MNTGKSGAQFTFTIPAGTNATASASQRHAQYISSGTASATITLTSVNGATPPAGFPAVTKALTSGSSACVSTNGTLQCAISVAAPPGADTFGITLSDSAGAALSSNSETVTVVAGQNAAAAPLVLGGVAAGYVVQPATDAATTAHVSVSGSGFRIIGALPYTFTVSPVDASGATMIGPGTPAVTLTSPSSNVTASAVTGQANTYTVQVKTQSATPIVLTAQTQGAAALNVPVTTVPEYFIADTGAEEIRAYSLSGAPANTSTTATAIPSDSIAISTNAGAIGGIAFDPSGKLWVSDQYHNTVSQYTIGSATALNSLSVATPWQIAFDANGYLWVGSYANFFGVNWTYVDEDNPSSGYTLNSTNESQSNDVPLAVSASGAENFVGYNATAKGFDPNGNLLRTINVGITVSALAFDASGNIWYASPSNGGYAGGYNASTGASAGFLVGFGGQITPVSIKFDNAGDLLVLDKVTGQIWVEGVSGLIHAIPMPGITSGNVDDMAIQP
jgi:hypothetical protein